MARNSIVFKGTEMNEHLASRYKAAAGGDKWWVGVLDFAVGQTRKTTKGSSTTTWVNVFYISPQGVRGPAVARFHGETHVGQIKPKTEAAAAEMNASAKNPAYLVEPRPGNCCLQVQKWTVKVETEADGITVITDSTGEPVLPGDDQRSVLFGVLDYISKAFVGECNERIARGEALVAEAKRKGSTPDSVAAFAPAGAFLAPEQITAIRKAHPGAVDRLTAGAIVGKLTVISPVQEAISANAKRNAGQLLPNPLARVTLKFNQVSGAPDNLQIFDMNRATTVNGRVIYEEATVGSEPVNADNVHKFVLPRSTFDAIVKMDSVCFSQMGVSMPMSAKVLVLRQPVASAESGLDALYADFEAADFAGAAAAGAAAAGAAAAGAAAAGAAAAGSPAAGAAAAGAAAAGSPAAGAAEDYDALLEELGGDD